MKIVIIGGVAAGASAATKARRANENAEIIVFEKGPYVSFANCGLPYFVGGDILRKSRLILVTPKLFREQFNIDIRINHEVIDIDPKSKNVTVMHQGETIQESYDKLVLATGGEPIKPALPGINLPQVHTVFTVPDVEGIKSMLTHGVESAVVVGGGFIGLEIAEALLKKGINTTLVERMSQLVTNFDPEFSLPVERHLQNIGLKIILGKSLKAIMGTDKVEVVELEDGTLVKADMVIMSVGARPRLELAKKAGLKIGQAGGVLVDATMLSSDRHIYAAGDIVESLHLVSGKKERIPLAGSANKQGRVAGANAAGSKLLFKGVLGSAIIKAGDLTVARTGLNEKEAKELGMEYYVSYTPAFSHATYYPDSKSMIIKMVVEKFTGRVLGAQGVGWKGVDKRIDVLATAIYAKLSVFDLEQLDLAYAPPYASAKDPAIMGGMVAANILRGEVRTITPAQLNEIKDQDDVLLVDVRTPQEFKKGSIKGAILIPVVEIRTRYQELDNTKRVILYCEVGYRAYNACRFLLQKGYDVYNVSGGYDAYAMNI